MNKHECSVLAFSRAYIWIAVFILSTSSYAASFRLFDDESTKECDHDKLDKCSSLFWPFRSSHFFSYVHNSHGAGSPNGQWRVTRGSAINFHKGSDGLSEDWIKTDNWIDMNDSDTCDQVILSPIAGKVIFAGERNSNNYGKQVIIQPEFNSDIAIRIAHLNEINVIEGNDVEVYDEIGLIGKTGDGGGPICHAHISLYRDLYKLKNSTETGFQILSSTGNDLGLGHVNYPGGDEFKAGFYLDATEYALVDLISSSWYESFISNSTIKYIGGVSDGQFFSPELTVTRETAVRAFAKFHADKIPNMPEKQFLIPKCNIDAYTDVAKGHPFCSFFQYLQLNLLIPDWMVVNDKIEPDRKLTRQETAMLFAPIFQDMKGCSIGPVINTDDIPGDVVDQNSIISIMLLYYNGVMVGKSDNKFEPVNNLSRADLAKIISVTNDIERCYIEDKRLFFGKNYEFIIPYDELQFPSLSNGLLDALNIFDNELLEIDIKDFDETADGDFFQWKATAGQFIETGSLNASHIIWEPPSVNRIKDYTLEIQRSTTDGHSIVLSKTITVNPSDPNAVPVCVIPATSAWVINEDCRLIENVDVYSDILVQANVVLYLDDNVTLRFDSDNKNIVVKNGGGIFIPPTSKIQSF